MNGRYLAAALATIPLAVAAIACRGNRDPQVQVVTGNAENLGISVSGTGEVEAPPDTAFFTVGVQVTAATVAEARAQAATSADKMLVSLKANSIAEADIKTAGLNISPVYDYQQGKEPTITGYQVVNTMTVKVRQVDAISKVVDDAIDAGGNATRLQSIWFGIENDKDLIVQAREAAVKDARAKAEQLAAAAGTKVGALQQMSEGTPMGDLVSARSADMAYSQALASTPIQPGTSKVSITVNARWLIE